MMSVQKGTKDEHEMPDNKKVTDVQLDADHEEHKDEAERGQLFNLRVAVNDV